jgi:hypothetical protein
MFSAPFRLQRLSARDAGGEVMRHPSPLFALYKPKGIVWYSPKLLAVHIHGHWFIHDRT